MNIFVQHRLKYGEFDEGNGTCQDEMDSDKKLGRNRVIVMSLEDRKQVETFIVLLLYYNPFLPFFGLTAEYPATLKLWSEWICGYAVNKN